MRFTAAQADHQVAIIFNMIQIIEGRELDSLKRMKEQKNVEVNA